MRTTSATSRSAARTRSSSGRTRTSSASRTRSSASDGEVVRSAWCQPRVFGSGGIRAGQRGFRPSAFVRALLTHLSGSPTMLVMDTLDRSLDFLARTPHVLRWLLDGLEDSWVHADEGPD